MEGENSSVVCFAFRELTSSEIAFPVSLYERSTVALPIRMVRAFHQVQSPGRCGAIVKRPTLVFALIPNSPRSMGLTTIAADQIWCGELVDSCSNTAPESTSVGCP